MPELKNTFIAGKMNKDLDSRLIPAGEYRDALNVKVTSSQGDDVGAVENVLSTQQLTTLSLGTTVNTVGAFFDNTADMIYWFVTSDTGDYVVEYNTITNTPTIVLTDTSANVLNFSINNLITGVGVLVDSDNNRRLLIWTDDLNPIRSINIETAKAYAANGFTNAQISLIKAPPLSGPRIVLNDTSTDQENNISDRFLRFSHRYRYADGEVSALSPFTETAFMPQSFNFDYSTASNESMQNQFNQVNISFNTGVSEVVGIDIVMKESNSTTVYLVQSFNKVEESWADNTTQSFNFNNNKIYTALPADQLTRLFDAVPLKAKALELIGNRVLLGNYTEGYNITNSMGDRIKIDFTLDLDTTAIVAGVPTNTLKSNRGYEIGIVYLDDFGRMSTVLTSTENTVFIPNSDSINQNRIRVTLVNEPPSWATRYRFFLKQTRTDYETIVPVIFYADGVYVWVRLEADDAQKVAVGDVIYVKSDSSEILATAAETRVLEITTQEVNFLENTPPDPFEVLQQAGTYMRIKPTDFNLNPDSVSVYEQVTEGFRSDNTSNNFSNNIAYLEPAVYYGTIGLNDLTESGTFVGTDDIRYEIEIFTTGATDTFRWREITTSDGVVGPYNDNGGAGFNITGAAQALSNGLSITFGATTGHSTDDAWTVSAKSTTRVTATNEGGAVGSLGRRALMHYKGKATTDTNGEGILAGAVVSITYDDSRSDDANVTDKIGRFVDTFISSATYANIEEWFFGENIISQLTFPTAIGDVIFRRGNLSANTENVTIDTAANMIMTFSSSARYQGASNNRVRTDSIIEIRELDNNIIFETIPTNNDSELFFEIGRTYDITGGFHQGFDNNDQDQTGAQNAILILPVFNAFSWGNGFESYKIRDLFNANTMRIDSRPLGVVENYRENVRIADLTYSKPFEQSSNFNGLNEFNLSTANFLQMDDKFGSIQKLFSANTNIEVFQEDKVHNVLFNKDVLTNADGQGNIRESTNVLGNTPVPWNGEYGISTHPESFVFYGNMRYWTDVRRGTVLRRSQNGTTEITHGMKDFFRDAWRANPTTRKFGAYDLHDKEYVIHDAGQFTISFNEDLNGYPSFYSFQPQWMGSLNNQFYSFSNGQLHRHYDSANAARNNFYGVNYNSTLKLIVNEAPSDIKVIEAINLEGNKAWAATIRSYLNDETTSITQSTITVAEFLNKEGKFYGYARRNELVTDFTAKSVYGLGQVTSVATSVITMSNPISSQIRVGDSLYDAAETLIGVINDFDRTANTITVSTTPTIAANTFVYGRKDGRIEGSSIRGYNFEIDLVDSTNLRTELFALNSNVFKSYPS